MVLLELLLECVGQKGTLHSHWWNDQTGAFYGYDSQCAINRTEIIQVRDTEKYMN